MRDSNMFNVLTPKMSYLAPVHSRLFLYFICLFDYFTGFEHQRGRIKHKDNGAKMDQFRALKKYLGQKTKNYESATKKVQIFFCKSIVGPSHEYKLVL